MNNEIKETYVRLIIDRKLIINQLKDAEKKLKYTDTEKYVEVSTDLGLKLEKINSKILKMRKDYKISLDDVYALETYGFTNEELKSKLAKIPKRDKGISLRVWNSLFVKRT